MTTHGQINWNELRTSNPQTAMSFYSQTVGWSFGPETMPDGGTYWIIMANDVPVGGIFDTSGTPEEQEADFWITYIHVDNVDDRLANAVDIGADVKREPWDVPGVGRVAVLCEPGGAIVGWVSPARL